MGGWSVADTDNKLKSNDNVANHYSPRHTVQNNCVIFKNIFLYISGHVYVHVHTYNKLDGVGPVDIRPSTN